MSPTKEERNRKIGHRCLPHLVRFAREKKRVTYDRLARILRSEGFRVARTEIGNGLGCIRDEIFVPQNLPLLNVLVVNQETGYPGEGWLPGEKGARLLTEEQDRYLVKRLTEDVFLNAHRTDLDVLLEKLGMNPDRQT
jgi:hypothetical protein